MAINMSLSSFGASEFLQLLIALTISIAMYSAGVMLYNLYIHPLSKFPGPRLAAATSIWYARLQVSGTCPMKTSLLHEKYGPVVRIAPDELSFINPVTWKEIYGHRKPGQPELQKDKKYHAGFGKEPTLINSDRDYHSYLRKLLAYGFSESSLRQQESVVQYYLDQLVKQLADKSSGGENAVDLGSWYNYFTFDVIGYLTYGESFDCLSSSNLHLWVKLFFSIIRTMAYSQTAGRLPWIFRKPFLLSYISSDVRTAAKTEQEIVQSKVKHRLEVSPPAADFMEKLISAYKSSKMSFFQLEQNSRILMGAGSETTATLLSGMTFLLMKHPKVLERLQAEIRGTFPAAEDITMTSVNTCKHLLAVIEESLRVYPPSPAAHPRYVPPGGMMIDGHFVPGGVAVGVTTYAMHHSSYNFRRPEEFVPERWMGEMSEFEADKREAVQPFSFGPRNCIGRNLAYVELKMVMARLLWQFDLENCSADDWADQRVFMIWEKKPLMVKLRPRTFEV